VPLPPWLDPTYPKASIHPELVGTFCAGAISPDLVNRATGLPGPGALALPVTARWFTP